VEEYAALKKPEKAAEVQAEMAGLAMKVSGAPGGK
jgi:hypothetical protein